MIANARLLRLWVLIPLVCGAQPQPPAAIDRQSTAYEISVNVDLVVLHATVLERKGGFASDLHEQDFEVFEDGARQSIRLFSHEDVPVTVGLVIDHSGSMHHKLQEVTAAARSFVASSNRNDEIFVVNFNETVTLGLPAAIRFSASSEALERAIWNAPTTGKTALYDAIAKSLEQLQRGSGDKKVLIVVSDGGDNASRESLAGILELAEQSSAVIYTIGIFEEEDQDRNPKVLERIARETGGEAFFPRRHDEVVAVCERIARDIRNQYTIGYVPTNAARNGAYRTIRVAARASNHGKLSVRTRSGYIFAGESPPVQRDRGK